MNIRISQSFSGEEIALLAQLLETLLRGGDVRMLVKHRAFKKLQSKAKKMQERINAIRTRPAPSTHDQKEPNDQK